MNKEQTNCRAGKKACCWKAFFANVSAKTFCWWFCAHLSPLSPLYLPSTSLLRPLLPLFSSSFPLLTVSLGISFEFSINNVKRAERKTLPPCRGRAITVSLSLSLTHKKFTVRAFPRNKHKYIHIGTVIERETSEQLFPKPIIYPPSPPHISQTPTQPQHLYT